MNGTTQDSAIDGTAILGLSLWIAAPATVAWMMLWFLSGSYSLSLLATLAAMTLLAIRSSDPALPRREEESLASVRPVPLEGVAKTAPAT